MRLAGCESTQKRQRKNAPRMVGRGASEGEKKAVGLLLSLVQSPLRFLRSEEAPDVHPGRYLVIIGLCSTVVIESLFTMGAAFLGMTAGPASWAAIPGELLSV